VSTFESTYLGVNISSCVDDPLVSTTHFTSSPFSFSCVLFLQFNEERVLSGIKRLKAAKTSSSQQRMDSFFKVTVVVTTQEKQKEKLRGKGISGRVKI
jgi:hypothetical protein